MLDIGWSELMLIGVVALIVVGPKDLPRLFKMGGQYMGRARGMAREFQRSMEQAADDTGLKDAADSMKSIDRLNMGSATSSARKYAEGLVKGPGGTGTAMKPPSAVPVAAKPAAPEPVGVAEPSEAPVAAPKDTTVP